MAEGGGSAYCGTPAELRWAPSHLTGAEEMMRCLPSQGHPMLHWFPQTLSSVGNARVRGEPGRLDDFAAKRRPSRPVIPSFRGRRKSSAVIQVDVGKSLAAT